MIVAQAQVRQDTLAPFTRDLTHRTALPSVRRKFVTLTAMRLHFIVFRDLIKRVEFRLFITLLLLLLL